MANCGLEYIALCALKSIIQWSAGHHRPRNQVDISSSYKVKKDRITRKAQGGVSSLAPLFVCMDCGIHKSHVIQPCHSTNLSFRQWENLAYSPKFPFTKYSGYTVLYTWLHMHAWKFIFLFCLLILFLCCKYMYLLKIGQLTIHPHMR